MQFQYLLGSFSVLGQCSQGLLSKFGRLRSEASRFRKFPFNNFTRFFSYSGFHLRVQGRSSVWSALSPRRFSFHTTQSGEGSRRSKRSASTRCIPIPIRVQSSLRRPSHRGQPTVHFFLRRPTMHKRFSPRLFAIVLGLTMSAVAQTSQWVFVGPDGKLQYKILPNVNNPSTIDGDHIMDFSSAGYMGGGVSLPNLPVRRNVSPSGGDDTSAI